ncbi:MAG: 1-acyl-sn-glycerol-3-phosphate acyltransferase, partial [Pseudomonadales bacterium]|nr:1-acyl-sn-glycerol-3-phosphate acyltransferase [Pseudomonadales bacterium]
MAKKNKNAHLPEATFVSFLRSLLFYIISIPSILSGGIFLIPLFVLLPFKWRWFCLTRLLSLLILQAKYIAGINYKITGLDNLPNTPYVALCKHQSPWETFFLFILLNPVSTVMKRSLLLMPSFGWGIAMTKPIAIDRHKGRKAFSQLLRIGLHRLQVLKMPVLIFPEGTRIPYGKQGNYKRGGVELAV